jgi:hypothetical protein
MERNQTFIFTTPDGVEITAVVVNVVNADSKTVYLCYAQNRLFELHEESGCDLTLDHVIAEYCVIPEYDEILKYTLI